MNNEELIITLYKKIKERWNALRLQAIYDPNVSINELQFLVSLLDIMDEADGITEEDLID